MKLPRVYDGEWFVERMNGAIEQCCKCNALHLVDTRIVETAFGRRMLKRVVGITHREAAAIKRARRDRAERRIRKVIIRRKKALEKKSKK